MEDFRNRVQDDVKERGCGDQNQDILLDHNIQRFLTARNGDVAHAQEYFRQVLDWRQSVNFTSTICTKCARNPTAHRMQVVALDKFQRPVIYTCFQKARDRWNVAESQEHLIQLLRETEQFLDATYAETQQTKWVVVIDFYGFGLWDNNPNMGLQALQLFTNFPERMGLVLLLDAPYLFLGLWKILTTFALKHHEHPSLLCTDRYAF